MTKRDILELAIKIIGIYMVIWILNYIKVLPLYISKLEKTSFLLFFIEYLIIILIYFTIIYYFIFRTDCITNKICKENKIFELRNGIQKETIEDIAFIIIGIYIIVSTFPILIQIVISAFQQGRFKRINFSSSLSYLVSYIVQICIGIYLVLGSKGLVNTIKKLRGA